MSQSEQMANFRKMINESVEEATACSMTAEGSECPTHGLMECPGYMEENTMDEDINITVDGDEAHSLIDRLMQLAGNADNAADVALDAAGAALDATDVALDATDSALDVARTDLDMPAMSTDDSHYVCDDCGNDMETCMCADDVCPVCNSGDCHCDEVQDPDQMSTITHGLIDSEHLDEEDYGHENPSSMGKNVDVNSYMYKGPKLAQRLVKGVMGDNPIADANLSEATMDRFVKLANDYANFLAESDMPNEDGQASPLTAADRTDFDKDPFAGDDVKDDGSMSPMSQIKRQDVMK